MGKRRLSVDNYRQKEAVKVTATPGQKFFCCACLTDKHAGEQSQDDRYCVPCYQFLKAEAAQLPPGRHPAWLPKGITTPQVLSTALPAVGHNCAPTVSMVPGKSLIMSTSKRGPKNKVLPEDLIVKLARRGMSPKNIAARLCGSGIVVSSRTIKRMLLNLAKVGKTEGD